jgi:hypothetical protein
VSSSTRARASMQLLGDDRAVHLLRETAAAATAR